MKAQSVPVFTSDQHDSETVIDERKPRGLKKKKKRKVLPSQEQTGKRDQSFTKYKILTESLQM